MINLVLLKNKSVLRANWSELSGEERKEDAEGWRWLGFLCLFSFPSWVDKLKFFLVLPKISVYTVKGPRACRRQRVCSMYVYRIISKYQYQALFCCIGRLLHGSSSPYTLYVCSIKIGMSCAVFWGWLWLFLASPCLSRLNRLFRTVLLNQPSFPSGVLKSSGNDELLLLLKYKDALIHGAQH